MTTLLGNLLGSDLLVAEAPAEFALTFDAPVGIDVSKRVLSDPPSNPSVVCTDLDSGIVIDLGVPSSIEMAVPLPGGGTATNVVAQQLDCSLFTVGHRYLLAASFDVAAGNRQTAAQIFKVKF